jgi:hypothetical protein
MRRYNAAVSGRLRQVSVGRIGWLVAWTLVGCRAAPPPVANVGPNRIRTDGIYACRGVEVRVSRGGWPPLLNFGPGRARWAYFLRFYPYGNGETRFMGDAEPITTAEAVRRIDGMGGIDSANGRTSLPDDHRVHIVFPRPFPAYADGVISDGNLILRWSAGHGPEGAEESYVFRFVKWP